MKRALGFVLTGSILFLLPNVVNSQRELKRRPPKREINYAKQLSIRLNRLEAAIKRLTSTVSSIQKRFVLQERRIKRLEYELKKPKVKTFKTYKPVPPKTGKFHMPKEVKERIEKFKKLMMKRKEKGHEFHGIKVMPFGGPKGMMFLRKLKEKHKKHETHEKHEMHGKHRMHEKHGMHKMHGMHGKCKHHGEKHFKHHGHFRCPFFMNKRNFPFILRMLKRRFGMMRRPFYSRRSFGAMPRLRMMIMRFRDHHMKHFKPEFKHEWPKHKVHEHNKWEHHKPYKMHKEEKHYRKHKTYKKHEEHKGYKKHHKKEFHKGRAIRIFQV